MITLKQYLTERFGVFTAGIIKRMAKGAFWSFTGTALAKAIVLASSIICAHILGKAEYGEFGMVRSTVNMFVALGSAGMGVTASKYISEYLKSNIHRVVGIYRLTTRFALMMGLVVALAVFLGAEALAQNTLGAAHLAGAIRIGAFLLFITILNGAQSGTMSGFENFRGLAINNFIGSVCESILMLIGAYLWGVSGAVLGFGTGFIALYISNNISIHRLFKQRGLSFESGKISSSDYKILYKFSLPAAISSMLIAPSYWIVRTFVVKECGFEELAIYEAADQWRAIILFIPSAISGIVLPILSSTLAESESNFWKVFKMNLSLNTIIAAIIAVMIVLLSPYLMKLYGSGYADHTVMRILALSTVFSTISNVIGLSIYSRAKTWIGLIFNIIWAIIMILSSSLLVSNGLGAKGMAFGVVIAYVVHSINELLYIMFLNNKGENEQS